VLTHDVKLLLKVKTSLLFLPSRDGWSVGQALYPLLEGRKGEVFCAHLRITSNSS